MKGNYYTARFKFQKITVKVATQELRQQTKWLKRTAPLFGSQLDFQKRSSIPSSPSLACCCGGFDAATRVPPDPSPRAASLQLRRSLARDPRTGGCRWGAHLLTLLLWDALHCPSHKKLSLARARWIYASFTRVTPWAWPGAAAVATGAVNQHLHLLL